MKDELFKKDFIKSASCLILLGFPKLHNSEHYEARKYYDEELRGIMFLYFSSHDSESFAI